MITSYAKFSVQDCIIFTVTPPDFSKAPFRAVRQLVPIRLTTDSWSVVGMDVAYFEPPTPPEDQQDQDFNDHYDTQ